METLISRCIFLMNKKGENPTSLADKINASPNTVRNWFSSHKTAEPKTADAVKIAQVLGTSVEYLVTGKEPDFPFLTPKEKKIVEIIKTLDDNDIDRLTVFAESLALTSRGENKRDAG